LLVALLAACAKSDDIDDPNGGAGGSGGSGGSGGESGGAPIDPLCEQLCAKTRNTCQGCVESSLQICNESLLDPQCGAQNRTIAECVITDAATVTCEDDTPTIVGCEAQILELRKCEAPADWCDSAFDGECNEPDPCPAGSDTTDCSGS
jgi:hypothetical protein